MHVGSGDVGKDGLSLGPGFFIANRIVEHRPSLSHTVNRSGPRHQLPG